jgi:hypothetical protein
VIEHHHLRRAGLALDQRFDFREIDRLELGLVVEVAHLGIVRRQDEGLLVERELVRIRPRIAHAHLEELVVAIALRHASARWRIIGHRLDAEIGQVIDRRLDVGQADSTVCGGLGYSDIRHFAPVALDERLLPTSGGTIRGERPFVHEKNS